MKSSDNQIKSFYHHERGPRVYASPATLESVCGITDPSEAKNGILLHPYMIVNILDVIDDRIEQAVEEHDLDRERALHCLYSQLITASQDAGFDTPIALRHLDEWDKPIEDECEILEPYGRVPFNLTEEDMAEVEQFYPAILKAVASGDNRKIDLITREIADRVPNPHRF